MNWVTQIVKRNGYWPAIVTALVVGTVPPIAIHYATKKPDQSPPPNPPIHNTAQKNEPAETVLVQKQDDRLKNVNQKLDAANNILETLP